MVLLLVALCLLMCGDLLQSVPTEMCPRLSLENGRVRLKSRNRVAKFRCRRNYLMIEGDRFVTCSLGTWRGTVPKCVGSGCDGDFSIPHGRYLLLFGDSLAQFECNIGYNLVGSSALSCNGRRWNDTTPACRPPVHTIYDCNFESPSLCTWEVEVNQLRWEWGRGLLRGAGTRPAFDQTIGNSTGHYMYVDGSGHFPKGAITRLYSPVLLPFRTSPSCATLWVYMSGHTTGELNIYLKPSSEPLDLLPPELTLTGHQGDSWRIVYLSLQDIDEDFQVVLEVVWGPTLMYDISVDDFEAAEGSLCMTLEMLYITQTMDSNTLWSTSTQEPSTTGVLDGSMKMTEIVRQTPILLTAVPTPPDTTLYQRTTPTTSTTNTTTTATTTTTSTEQPSTKRQSLTIIPFPPTAPRPPPTPATPPTVSNAVAPPILSTVKSIIDTSLRPPIFTTKPTTLLQSTTTTTSSSTITNPTTTNPTITSTTTTTTTTPKTTPITTTPPPTTTPTTSSTPTTSQTSTTTTTTTTSRPTTTKLIIPKRTTVTTSTTTSKPSTLVQSTIKPTTTTTNARIKRTTRSPWFIDLFATTNSRPIQPKLVEDTTKMPISDKVTSPEQEKQFYTYLTVLLVTLGVTSLFICMVILLKKFNVLHQNDQENNSDVKYLQQNDDEDANSMVYHPSTSGSSSSSRSSIVSSGTSSFRVPVRPPPPVPPHKKQQEVSLPPSVTLGDHTVLVEDWSTRSSSSVDTEQSVARTSRHHRKAPPPVPPRSSADQDSYDRFV